MNQETVSMLALPGDNQTIGVALVISARDRQLRLLRHPHVWEAVVRRNSTMSRWVDSESVSDVRPLSGIDHVHRTYVIDGKPVIAGVVPIGDALAATNPTLGLGISVGAMEACALRDVLFSGAENPTALTLQYQKFCDINVKAAVNMALSYDGHRLEEIDSEISGNRYETNDASWPITVALENGARHDPVVRRAHVGISSLLKDSAQVLEGDEIRQRLAQYMAGSRYPEGSLSRQELLSVVAEASELKA
ncbi:hypothetical protein ACFRH6_33450 [Streptomyces sp. NPDC056749]|uniref:hypothetical protein n=1 Tax=Streptomyces sp. NPDC056749 TaxID=3345936 RepID=UPI0036A1B8D4